MSYEQDLAPTWPQIIKRTLWEYKWILPLCGLIFFGLGTITYAVTLIHLEVMTVPTFAEADVNYAKNGTWEYVGALVWSLLTSYASLYYMRKWRQQE